MKTVYTCKYCGFGTRFLKLYLRHCSVEHENHPLFSVNCPIDDCDCTFHKVNSLRKHIYRKHKNKSNLLNSDKAIDSSITNGDSDQFVGVESDNISLEKFESENEEVAFECENNSCASRPTSVVKYEQEINKFLLNLRVKKLITESCSEEIATKFRDLVGHCIDETTSVLSNPEVTSKLSVNEVNNIISPLQNLNSSLSNLDSIYKQKQKIKQGPYVAPVSIDIGDGDKIVYVPLLENLKCLLSHEDIVSFIIDNHHQIRSNHSNGVIHNFRSSEKCQQNSFLLSSNNIHISLYIDDFVLTNPLGTSAKTHKLCAIYYLINNIPFALRSKLHNIQLVSLFPSSHIKKHGFDIILRKLVEDLKILETNGVNVELNGQHVIFFGTITALVADNLASHEIGGYITSFSGFRRCRFCNGTSDSIQLYFNESKFQLRTPDSYDSQVIQVIDNPHMSSVYGIKNNCILNELENFHICWSAPSDIAHDVYEGLCLDLLKIVIEHCLLHKFFSLKFLNNIISSFSYSGRDRANKPAQILSTSQNCVTIKETAAQCHNLLRLLPYFVGHLIPESDRYWKCYIMFLNVLDYILAPSLHIGHIKHMEDLISEFLFTYKNLDDTVKIKPKGHFLLHYATQYQYFGPLIEYSTLRFESKHSSLKSVFSNCKNFINPCYTIADRHQYLQSLHHMEKDFILEDYSEFSRKFSLVTVSSMNCELIEQIENKHSSETLKMYKSVESCGITYELGNVLLYGCDDEYQFGLIENITCISNSLYFILKKCDIVEFNTHLHGYILQVNDNYLLLDKKNVFSPFSLPAYKTQDNELYVRLHHFVHGL